MTMGSKNTGWICLRRMSLNLQKCEDNKRCREYTILSSCLYIFVLVNNKDERQLFSGQLSSYTLWCQFSNEFACRYMSVRVSLLGMQASHRKWRKFCCSLTFVPHKFLHRRDEICHERRDQRSWKSWPAVQIFPEKKQSDFLHDLSWNTDFTHTKCGCTLILLSFYTFR